MMKIITNYDWKTHDEKKNLVLSRIQTPLPLPLTKSALRDTNQYNNKILTMNNKCVQTISNYQPCWYSVQNPVFENTSVCTIVRVCVCACVAELHATAGGRPKLRRKHAAFLTQWQQSLPKFNPIPSSFHIPPALHQSNAVTQGPEIRLFWHTSGIRKRYMFRQNSWRVNTFRDSAINSNRKKKDTTRQLASAAVEVNSSVFWIIKRRRVMTQKTEEFKKDVYKKNTF